MNKLNFNFIYKKGDKSIDNRYSSSYSKREREEIVVREREREGISIGRVKAIVREKVKGEDYNKIKGKGKGIREDGRVVIKEGERGEDKGKREGEREN